MEKVSIKNRCTSYSYQITISNNFFKYLVVVCCHIIGFMYSLSQFTSLLLFKFMFVEFDSILIKFHAFRAINCVLIDILNKLSFLSLELNLGHAPVICQLDLVILLLIFLFYCQASSIQSFLIGGLTQLYLCIALSNSAKLMLKILSLIFVLLF